MSTHLRIAANLLALVVVLSVAETRAQTTTGNGEAPAESRPRVAPVRESVLDVFYYRDASGKLVPVVEAVTLEELDEYKRSQLNQMARSAAPEPYRFQGDIEFRVGVGEQQADVEAVFPIRLNAPATTNDGEPLWIRVPLRMNRAVLAGGSSGTEQQGYFISYDREGDGYVAWCDASRGDYEIRLKLKTPLVHEAGLLRFSMVAPAGPTRFVVTLPGEALDVSSNNEEANIITTRALAGGATEIQVENVGGPLTLSWRDRKPLTPVLKVAGTTRATINGRQVDCEAVLKVQSFGGPVESFDVRLPPGLQLIPENRPGLDVTVLEDDAPTQRQTVRVTRQDPKSSNSLEVKLRALTPTPPQADAAETVATEVPALPNGRFEMMGFDVRGAMRQSGALEVVVQGDWTVDWFPGPYVRQVAVGPRQDGVTARFEYDRYPCSLLAEVRPRESRVQIEPKYTVRVSANELRLQASLNYKISGAQTRELRLNAGDWTIEQVTPAELVGTALVLDQTQPLVIPLARGTLSVDDQRTIQITARRPLDTTEGSFQVSLPRPVAGVSVPAAVEIIPDANIELLPRSDDVKGLVPETPTETSEPSDRRPRSLMYREELAAEASVFAADYIVRTGITTVDIESTLRFNESAVAVEQVMQYRIDYEPIQELQFRLPAELAEDERLQLFLDDRPLTVTNISVPLGEPGLERVQMSVALPKPRIEPTTVVARYGVPLPELAAGEPKDFAIDLVQPVEDGVTTVRENRLHLMPAERLEVELVDELWDMVADPSIDGNTVPEQIFQFTGEVARCRLTLTRNETPRSSSTVVDRMWIQSWLDKTARQDRACLKLFSGDPELAVRLPAEAELMALAVDRVSREPAETPDGILHVELPENAAGRPVTVELWYRIPIRDGLLKSLSISGPEVAQAGPPQRTYWQLILPRNELLVWAPDRVTSESVWRWDVHQLRRHPNRSQAELEALLDASEQEPPSDTATNQYLFSSIEAVMPVRFLTVSRAMLTLSLSAAALALGLVLIYAPGLRHPAVFLIGGLAVIGVGYVYPESAILASQAAAIGIVLVLMARLLQWNLSRRSRGRPVYIGSGMISMDSRSEADETPSLLDDASDKDKTLTAAGMGYPAQAADPDA